MLQLIVLSLFCLVIASRGLIFTPDLLHLHPDILTAEIANAIDNLRRAAVPVSLGSSVAIGISEGVAGAIGGLASRKTADAIGDRKIDSVLTKITVTGAYFGSRGVIITASRVLGLPKPLAVPFATVLASVISESAKAIGRSKLSPEQKKSQEPFNEQLDPGEIVGDVVKWLSFDALDDGKVFFKGVNNDVESVIASCTYGAISAFAGSLSRDIVLALERRMPAGRGKAGGMLKSYSQSAVEGAVLFGCYQVIVLILQMIFPESLSMKFVFNNIIEGLEGTIETLDEL